MDPHKCFFGYLYIDLIPVCLTHKYSIVGQLFGGPEKSSKNFDKKKKENSQSALRASTPRGLKKMQ